MKLRIHYPTKERRYISEHTFQHVYKEAELEPVRIIRYPCGEGAAAHRYRYYADFHAPDDAAMPYDGLIRESINRKQNPKFNPKKLDFDGMIWNAGDTDDH